MSATDSRPALPIHLPFDSISPSFSKNSPCVFQVLGYYLTSLGEMPCGWLLCAYFWPGMGGARNAVVRPNAFLLRKSAAFSACNAENKGSSRTFCKQSGLDTMLRAKFSSLCARSLGFCISSLVSPESTFLPLHAPVPYSAPHERTAPCGGSVHVLSAPALEMPRAAATSAIFIIKGNFSSE